MTARKPPKTAEIDDTEQPSAGGSYLRQADGSLDRVEFTKGGTPGENEAAPAEDVPTGDGSGGEPAGEQGEG